MDDAEKLGSALAAELLDMGGLAALGEPLDREI
jgi:hypothetical protein